MIMTYPINWSLIRGFSKAEFAPTVDEKGVVLDKESLKFLSEYWDMHPTLIEKKVELRQKANLLKNTCMVVSENAGFSYSGHAENSLHYGVKKGVVFNDIDWFESSAEKDGITLGRAVDFHYESIKVGETGRQCWPWYEAAVFTYKHIDCRFGLGFYPHSNTGFIHLDIRHTVPHVSPTVWWRDKNGKYHFYTFDDFAQAMGDALHEFYSDQKITQGV